MSDNFRYIVNLRERVEQQRKEAERRAREEEEAAQYSEYEEDPDDQMEEEEAVAQSSASKFWSSHKLIKLAVLVLVLLIAGVAAYSFFFDQSALFNQLFKDPNWYLVKLVDGEIFYGQIVNTKADPIVMSNVYYNYDQAVGGNKNATSSPANGTGSLRLIKRGQETHGPDGTMDIVRSQVEIMERLKSDSILLKAILQYEAKLKSGAINPSASQSAKPAASANSIVPPSATPSALPSATPSAAPSISPSALPSVAPSVAPSTSPATGSSTLP